MKKIYFKKYLKNVLLIDEKLFYELELNKFKINLRIFILNSIWNDLYSQISDLQLDYLYKQHKVIFSLS